MADNTSFPIAFSPDGQKAILQVETDELPLGRLEDFEHACRSLVATRRQELTIDLSRLARIHSGFIGVVLYASAEAAQAGRDLRVAASERVAATLQQIAPGLIKFDTQA